VSRTIRDRSTSAELELLAIRFLIRCTPGQDGTDTLVYMNRDL
jgi:hypothetical protein